MVIFYFIYRDIIDYCDIFLDSNREMIFLILSNPIVKAGAEVYISFC